MMQYDKTFHDGTTAFTTDNIIDFKIVSDCLTLSQEQNDHLSHLIKKPVDKLYSPNQVHGSDVLIIDKDFVSASKVVDADAVVTSLHDVLIGVRTADCLAVLLKDNVNNVIAVVHAGWRGSKDGVASKVLDVMTERFDTDLKNVAAVFSPCIRSCCYEVGGEFLDHFPEDVTNTGVALYLDLAGFNKKQLISKGVSTENIFDNKICTCCGDKLFSYRREGDSSGRMFTGMMMQ